MKLLPNRFSIELDHVHNLDGIVGVILAEELDKAVSLVHCRHTVLRHVHVHHRTSLQYRFLVDFTWGNRKIQSTHSYSVTVSSDEI